jgi:preprotein translocase subunit SecA
VAERVSAQIEALLVDQAVVRVLGAVERRLEEDLELNRTQLDGENWDNLTDQVLDAIEAAYARRRQRLVGENGDGQIARDLDAILAKVQGTLGEVDLTHLLIQMPQGARATFDKRTHRRVWRRTTRLTYTYAAARLLENREPEEVAAEVLEHLEGAQAAMRRAWGRGEWSRLAAVRPLDVDETTQRGLRQALGNERFEEISGQPLQALPEAERLQVMDELGRQALTEVYRQLLLRVISELWVEYLTNMEALRVSIGLEAYAQRDPLVQYKNRAFEMFQELLSNMRLGVVTRMFTFRPADLSSIQTTVSRADAPEPLPEPVAVPAKEAKEKEPVKGNGANKAKRRRRRR